MLGLLAVRDKRGYGEPCSAFIGLGRVLEDFF